MPVVVPAVEDSSRQPQDLFDPSTPGRVATEVDNHVDSRSHHVLDRSSIHAVKRPMEEQAETSKGVMGIVGMHRRERSEMTGVQSVHERECFVSAYLTDHEAVRS